MSDQLPVWKLIAAILFVQAAQQDQRNTDIVLVAAYLPAPTGCRIPASSLRKTALVQPNPIWFAL
ncbi:hypothetical protein BH24ACI5_BH24ACI5_14920 [soil metagenome]